MMPEYMQRKRLTMNGAQGLRVTGESLLIPMWRDNEIISLQRIEPDGSKKFAVGAPSKGGHFWIDRKGAVVTILCEGFATGMTCFEAVQNSRVCVTFSAANMIEVATKLDWHGFVAVASDNDHAKPCPWCLKQGEHLQNPPNLPRPKGCRCNPGKTAAMEAARVIKCGCAVPPTAEGITDYNDLFCAILAAKESDAAQLPRAPHPARLRQAACASIGAALMNAARFVTP